MNTFPSTSGRFRFDEFEVNAYARELRKGGELIRLQEQPLQVLLFLLQHPGELVTREELRTRIWPKGTFVDFDHGLNTAIKKIRVALGDNASIPRYVETIPRRGYRFLLPVEVVADIDCRPLGRDASTTTSANSRRWRIARSGWPAAILLLPVFAVTLIYYFRPHSRTQSAQHISRVVLVVLPFENLSGDAGQDYLCQGFSEEVETQLGRADPSRLAVVARVTAAAYAKNRTVAEIGRDLHADYVLEGSVRRDARRIRVAAQLIRVHDQSHIWANAFDREMGSILAVQAEIADEIARQVRSTINLG